MQWRNSASGWGWMAVILHWVPALAVIGLFALGWWMTGLTYAHPWYQPAPAIHEAVGILLFALMLFRLLWRAGDRAPKPEPGQKRWEIGAAHLAHFMLYLGVMVVLVSGYLISTADGRAISVFEWFSVPATLSGIDGQEDIAGLVHWYVALALMGLTALHALAALKHHFIDRDRTLLRMLGRGSTPAKREAGEPAIPPLETTT